MLLKFQQEFAGIGGDVSFIRTTAEGKYYRELWADRGVVGMFKVKGGHVQGVGQRLKLPDHFFLGGESIRGFDSKGIGPRDRATGDSLGGRFFFAATAEANFPLPAVPDEFGFEGAVFSDLGTLFDVDDDAGFFRRVTVVGDEWRYPLVRRLWSGLAFAIWSDPRRLRLACDQEQI